MSNIFYGWTWMKVGTLSWMGGIWCQITKQLCFKDIESPISCFLFCFWLCFVVLQVIVFNVVFQWSNFGELVLVMEQNPCCLIDSRFLEMIGTFVSKERKDVDHEKLYEVGWGGGKEPFFWLKKWSSNSSNCDVVELVWIWHNN